MSLSSDYGIAAFGDMLTDGIRVPAYVRAMREAIQPGTVVLDLGAGAGFLSVVACQLGAEHVYAVEPNEAIRVGPALARENGCADRITFLQELSTEVELPRRADLVVADLRGVLPLFRHHLPSLADARRRHLAPGGILLPRRDTLWAAPVEASEEYRTVLSGWDGNDFGVSVGNVRRFMVNRMVNLNNKLQPEQLLAAPACWGTLDYATREDPNVHAELTWSVERAGTGHGVGAWFDAVVVEGIEYSTAPGQPDTIYGRAFFPWLRPVELEAGDQVNMSLGADLVGDDYLWRWSTRITSEAGEPKAEFRQSTLSGSLVSPASLQKSGANFQPQRSEEGEVALFCLSRMDAEHTLEDVARGLVKQFPERFPTEQAALERAASFSGRYSQ